jgi:hypothetical protein
MAERITVVISLAGTASRRDFEEKMIADLLIQDSVDLTIIGELSQLAEDTTGLLCLEGIKGSFVLVTDVSPAVAHDLLSESQIRGQLGTSSNGEVIVSESTSREALSPGVYDAMRRTLFILDIAEFVEVEDLGRSIASIQAHVEHQRLNASRSDFPILSITRTDDPSATEKGGGTTASEPAVLPMPRRGDREEEADTNQAQNEMDSLVDELDEMDL